MTIHVNAEQTSATVKPYEFQGNEKKALPCKRQLAYQDAQVAFFAVCQMNHVQSGSARRNNCEYPVDFA